MNQILKRQTSRFQTSEYLLGIWPPTLVPKRVVRHILQSCLLFFSRGLHSTFCPPLGIQGLRSVSPIEDNQSINQWVSDRASKRNYVRQNKTALGSRGQAETSHKIEDWRSNKTTGNFHKCFISCAAECPDNIYFI